MLFTRPFRGGARSVRACAVLPILTAAWLVNTGGSAVAQTWSNTAGGSWAEPSNWNPATVPNAIGAAVTFDTPGATRTITVDSGATGFTIGSLLSTNNSPSLTAANTTIAMGTTGSFLNFDNTGTSPATVTVEGTGLGNTTISTPSLFTDSVLAIVNDIGASSQAGALNWTGTVTGGTGGFTKQGPGTLTFGTGAKRYTGPTLLDTNSGRTRISVAGSPVSTSSFTVNPGAQITLITEGTYTLGTGTLFLNGSGLGEGSFPGNFPGAIRNNTNLVATITNPVVLQTDTLIHVQGLTGSTTFSNTIGGPGKLTLTAPASDNNLGTLALNGANTYAGGTVINGGTLEVGGSGTASLGTGDVTVNSGNSIFAGAVAKLTIQTGVANAIADTATLSLAGGGLPNFADDGFIDLGSGINDTIGGLVLGGIAQPFGTYGSTASAATFKNDEYFAGTGILTVVPEPGSTSMLLIASALAATARRRRSAQP